MLRVWVFALLSSVSLLPVADALPARVPGTRVSLDAPPGFVASERFAGFENAEQQSSIMVSELPGPASQMQKGMSGKALASRGMRFIRSEDLTIAGQPARLIHVSQSAQGVDYLKWILIGGDASKTIMVVGTFPEANADLSEPIRRAVRSASWGLRKASLYEGLTFRIDPTPKLRVAGRVSNMLAFTESGSMEPTDGGSDQGVLVFGSSISEAAIEDVEAFSRERAPKTEKIRIERIVSGRALTVDGLPGYELIADAKGVKDGRPLRMYQLVLADAKTYYIGQGFVHRDRGDEVVAQFRQVTGTFRRLHPPK